MLWNICQTLLKIFTSLSVIEDPDTTCGICLTSWFKNLVQSASCSQLHSGQSGSSLSISPLLTLKHPKHPSPRLILPTTLLAQKIQCIVTCVLWNLWLETNLLESIYYHPSIGNVIAIIDRQQSLQILHVIC